MQAIETKTSAIFADPAIISTSKPQGTKSQPHEASQKNQFNQSQVNSNQIQSKNQYVYTISELLAIRDALGHLPPPPDLPPIKTGDDFNTQHSESRAEEENHEKEHHRGPREKRLPAWARSESSNPNTAMSFSDFAPKDKDIRDLQNPEQEILKEEKEKQLRTGQRRNDGRAEKSTWKRDEAPPGFAPKDKTPRGDRNSNADSENRKERRANRNSNPVVPNGEATSPSGKEETTEGASEIVLSPPRKVFPSSQSSPVNQRKKQGKEKVYAPINASNETATNSREREPKEKETKEREPKENKTKGNRGNRGEGETSQNRSQKFSKKSNDVEKNSAVPTSESSTQINPANKDYSVTSSAVGNMNFIDALFSSAQPTGEVVSESDKEDDSEMSRAFKRWFAANQEAAKQQHQIQSKSYEEKLDQVRAANTPSPQIDISQSHILSVLFNKSAEKTEKTEKIEKTEKTEKTEKIEKIEKIEKVGKPTKVEKIETSEAPEVPKSAPPAPKTPNKLPDDPAIISNKKPTVSPTSSQSEPQPNILKLFENAQPTTPPKASSQVPTTPSSAPKPSQAPATPKERPITLEELFKSAQGVSLPPPPAKAVNETKIIKDVFPPIPIVPISQTPPQISPRGQAPSFIPETDSTSFINSLLTKTPNPFMDPFTHSHAPQDTFSQPFGPSIFGQQGYRAPSQPFSNGIPQQRQNLPQQEGDLSKWFGNNVYQQQVQPMPPMPSNVKMVSLEEIERSARSRK